MLVSVDDRLGFVVKLAQGVVGNLQLVDALVTLATLALPTLLLLEQLARLT